MISAQRQTFVRGESHEKQFYTASQLHVIDVFRITVSKAIELTIANRRSIASHVERLFAFFLGHFSQRYRLDQFFREGDGAALDEWSTMIEQTARWQAHAGARRVDRK